MNVGGSQKGARDVFQPLLELKEVTCVYGGLVAVDGVSFSIAPGEIVGLVGPNGAGKTTLLNAITGLARVRSGSVAFDGRDITHMPPYRRVELGMRRSFQLIRLFPELNVLDNVKLGLHPEQRSGFWSSLLHLPDQRQEEKRGADLALKALAELGMDSLAQKSSRKLSFGQSRRVELARVLMGKPRLLLLDEPTAGVHAAEIGRIASIVRMLQHTNYAALIVEHNLTFVREVCERILVMSYGKLLASGPVNETLQAPEVVAAYLGEHVA